jgi:hypothetical protein
VSGSDWRSAVVEIEDTHPSPRKPYLAGEILEERHLAYHIGIVHPTLRILTGEATVMAS